VSIQRGEVRHAFGRALRAAREAKGWTQDALGDQVGILADSVERIERGRSEPTLNLQWRLANALGMKVSDLWERAEEEMRR
jgi:transcriptional regulator with XRE-family HTH domain